MNRYKILSFLAVLVIGVVAFYLLTSSKRIGEGTFKLHYNAYACGDCSLQFEVKEVESDNLELNSLIGKLVNVKFTDEMDKEIELRAEKCAICFNYILTGACYQSKNGEVEIRATKLKLEESFEGCCAN